MTSPLDEWDAERVLAIASASAKETGEVEKKASSKLDLSNGQTRREAQAELAKQACAFANSGPGILIYGISDAGGLDDGVPEMVGHQTIKAWIEALIPKLVLPELIGAEAKLIRIDSHQVPGRGVVVVALPLSERRPHWVPGGGEKDTPYIRSGEHSLPMKLQTFLDLSHRHRVPKVEIVDIGQTKGPVRSKDRILFWINPIVRLVEGPHCRDWAFELTVPTNEAQLSITGGFQPIVNEHGYQSTPVIGAEPLFPGRPTRVYGVTPMKLALIQGSGTGNESAKATLRAGSAEPVVKEFVLFERGEKRSSLTWTE